MLQLVMRMSEATDAAACRAVTKFDVDLGDLIDVYEAGE